MDDSLKVKLKSALEQLHHNPQGPKVLAKLRSKRFIETRVEDYQPLFDAFSKAGIDIRTLVFLNNGNPARARSDARKVTLTRGRPVAFPHAQVN